MRTKHLDFVHIGVVMPLSKNQTNNSLFLFINNFLFLHLCIRHVCFLFLSCFNFLNVFNIYLISATLLRHLLEQLHDVHVLSVLFSHLTFLAFVFFFPHFFSFFFYIIIFSLSIHFYFLIVLHLLFILVDHIFCYWYPYTFVFSHNNNYIKRQVHSPQVW